MEWPCFDSSINCHINKKNLFNNKLIFSIDRFTLESSDISNIKPFHCARSLNLHNYDLLFKLSIDDLMKRKHENIIQYACVLIRRMSTYM